MCPTKTEPLRTGTLWAELFLMPSSNSRALPSLTATFLQAPRNLSHFPELQTTFRAGVSGSPVNQSAAVSEGGLRPPRFKSKHRKLPRANHAQAPQTRRPIPAEKGVSAHCHPRGRQPGARCSLSC
jgi:hypothetical protein